MKKQISSDATLIWKYIFPGLWISTTGIGVIVIVFHNAKQLTLSLFPFVGLAVSGYLIWFARRLKFVSMDDDFLYVAHLRKQIQIPLTHIKSVKENFLARPKLITITLHPSSEFGKKIVFVPTSLAFGALRSHPVVPEIESAVQRRRSRF